MAVDAQGFIGLGTDFQRSTDGGTTWATLGKALEITPPARKAKKVEGSYLQQADASERCHPGMIDEGEVKIKLYFTATSYNTVNGLVGVQNSNLYRILFSDPVGGGGNHSNVKFGDGSYIAELSPATPMNDNVTAEVTMQCSQAPTFTAAS